MAWKHKSGRDARLAHYPGLRASAPHSPGVCAAPKGVSPYRIAASPDIIPARSALRLPRRARDAADHGDRDRPTLPSQQHRQLVLAPARVPLPQAADSHRMLPRARRAVPALRPAGTALQSAQSRGIVTPLPAVESLTTSAKVPEGQGGIPAESFVVVEPRQPPVGLPAQVAGTRSRYLERGGLRATIRSRHSTKSVTNHSERAQQPNRGHALTGGEQHAGSFL